MDSHSFFIGRALDSQLQVPERTIDANILRDPRGGMSVQHQRGRGTDRRQIRQVDIRLGRQRNDANKMTLAFQAHLASTLESRRPNVATLGDF
jgi:hypothetical protein